jgi:hypothetical protein
MLLMLSFALSALPALHSLLHPGAAGTSKVWIEHYREYEEFLRTAAIARIDKNHVFFEPGGLAAGAAVHREGAWDRVLRDHTEYQAEIAAYKLDRILQLDLVPPTVERRVDNQIVSIQLWIENAMLLKEARDTALRAPDPDAWDCQLQRAHLFEDLVANVDKNEGSPVITPEWDLIVLDHSLAFTTTTAQPYAIGTVLDHVDRPFFDRVKTLDKSAVDRALGDLLEPAALGALFTRRDAMVGGFEHLAAEKGADRVFKPCSERK